MATQTTRLLLRKPDPNPTTGDLVNVVTDINDSMDKLDAAVGHLICTSGTRPTGTDRWDGRQIYETDTRRNYMWSAALTTWLPMLIGRGTDGPYLLGQSTDTTGQGINGQGTSAGTDIFRTRVTGDANPRLQIQADGKIWFGPGTAGTNVNLYWGATDQLKTDDQFSANSLIATTTITATTAVNGTTDVQRGGVSLGRGLLFRGKRTAAKTLVAGTETGALRLNATLLANRSFFIVSMGSVSSTVNEAAQVSNLFRFNTTGSNASTSDASLGGWTGPTIAGSGAGSYIIQALYTTGGSNVTMSVLLTTRRVSGTGTITIASADGGGPEIWFIDAGPSITQTGTDI